MTLEDAKALFKVPDKYQQAELDSIYDFEKSLLLDRISIEANPMELELTQTELQRLERAYSVLKLAIEKPSHKAAEIEIDIDTDDGKSSGISPGIIGAVAGVAIAIVAFFLLNPQQPQDSSEKTQDSLATSTTDAAPTTDTSSKPARSSRTSLQAQETAALLERAQRLNIIWQDISKAYQVNMPKILQQLFADAKDYQSKEYYSQANFSFEMYQKKLTEHIATVQHYSKSFNDNNALLSRWQQLPKNIFSYPNLELHQRPFLEVKQSLEAGKVVEISPAELEQLNHIFNQRVSGAETVSQQRKQYLNLKKRWQRSVKNSEFYQFTPAVANMIATAEKTPYNIENLDNIRQKIMPRLINHFKQQVR